MAALLLTMSACAKSPESIAPAYVSPLLYQNWSCKQLAAEQERLNAALATASDQQRRARTNDIVGVVLIGVPVSSLSGDNIAGEIARLKGEKETVHKVMIAKNCAI